MAREVQIVDRKLFAVFCFPLHSITAGNGGKQEKHCENLKTVRRNHLTLLFAINPIKPPCEPVNKLYVGVGGRAVGRESFELKTRSFSSTTFAAFCCCEEAKSS